MKYFFYILVIIMLFSCQLYGNKRVIVVDISEPGKLVLSSVTHQYETFVEKESHLFIEINKGQLYTILFYPVFGAKFSNYPAGNIVDYTDEYIIINKNFGPLGIALDLFNRNSVLIDREKVYKAFKKFNDIDDPWRYSSEDIKSYLLGEINISSIGKHKIYEIPELEYLKNMECENRTYSCWYKSLVRFKNNNTIYTVELFGDGSYNLL